MIPRPVVVLLAVTAVLLLKPRVTAQTNFGADPARLLQLQWEVVDRGGRTVLRGRVFNDSGFGAHDIRVLVERLDASGNVLTRTVGSVPFLVTPGTAGPFEVRLPDRAATYRVSILSFGWVLPDDDPLFRRW